MTGRYRKGRPYVAATVALPRMNVSGEIESMLDTDADLSVLSPADTSRLGYCLDGDTVVPLNGWADRIGVALKQGCAAR